MSAMTTPSTIVIEETDGSRLRAGGDDIANLAVLAQLGFGGPETATRTTPGHLRVTTAQLSAFSSQKHKQSRPRRRPVALATTGPKRAMDSRIVSAHQRESEQGVQEVSSALFNRVTNYHAQIGANVNKETLQSLEWQVLCHRTL